MTDYISHHGILGQRWGVRRYQNADGTLTEEGKRRYIKPGIKYNDRYLIPDRLTLAGSRAYAKSRNKYRAMLNKTARKSGKVTDSSQASKGNAEILSKGYIDYANSRAETNEALLQLTKYAKTILRKHGVRSSLELYDTNDIVRQIRKSNWDDETFESLHSKFEKARNNEQTVLKTITDQLIRNMGETRNNDFRIDSDELSAYEKMTRQILLALPEKIKLGVNDTILSETDWKR